jgi:hypothetical protein
MKDISQDFVNTLLEANAMLPKLTGGDAKLGNGNKWSTPTAKGSGSDSQENQGKGSGTVTGNQENAAAASKAGPSGGGEPKSDPASAGMDNFGLPSNIANKWVMPKTLKDHKEPDTPEDRIGMLEETVQSLCDIVKVLAEARTKAEKERDDALNAKFGSKTKEKAKFDANGNALNQAARNLMKKVTKGTGAASKKASRAAQKEEDL